MTDRLRLPNAILLSIVLHALVLSLLPVLRQMRAAPPAPLLDVDVVSLPPPARAVPPAPPPPAPAVAPPAAEPAPAIPMPKQQAVSPPDAGEEKPPKDTRLTSDQDNTVQQEMVRRGEPEPGAEIAGRRSKPPPESAKAAAKTAAQAAPDKPAHAAAGSGSQAPRMAMAPRLDDLLPSAPQLAREGYGQSAAAGAAAEVAKPAERNDLLRRGDAWHSASHRLGTLDFLPDIREGDVTLLNTKAELFSPFVRRVALRVFESLIISLRRDLGSVRRTAEETVTMEAIMNRRGDLVRLDLKERSNTGALATEHNLQQACYDGFFDRNPPPGAESADGNIHFLFAVHVSIAVDPNGRQSGQAIFSAGLL